ncbi:MAG: hypothetical protein O9342_07275 [Beijerinckiaceae bacterium]|nr:hypothetical protein [Beijerinckiaceae bacterium]
MVTFEALDAAHGDCLMVHYSQNDETGQPQKQLWLIDGGPTETYPRALAPRLRELQASQGGNGPLRIRLGVVTHIDDDHIDGMGKLIGAMALNPPPAGTPDVRFQEFWFNGFQATFGTTAQAGGSVASLASNDVFMASAPGPETAMFIQGVRDGETLLRNLGALKAGGRVPQTLNQSFGSEAHQKALAPRVIRFGANGPKLEILTPTQARLDALRTKWAEATGSDAALQAFVRGRIDTSVANLSSIVFLATIAQKTLLLTGDGLAEHIIEGWKERTGTTDPFPIDLMKVPHHGSSANNCEAFFRLFPARHYVFCANGKHDNPDMFTLEALKKACGQNRFTVHLTYEETHPATAAQTAFLKAMAAASNGRIALNFRKPDALSVPVEL